MNIQSYQNRRELMLEHPEVKSFELIYQAPRGQSFEMQKAGLDKSLKAKGRQIKTAYRIGDFFYTEAESTSLCICLERIGDNGPCPVQAHNKETQPCPER